jgi:Zn finger protein HypA/HybF involved in hydrogenase expression
MPITIRKIIIRYQCKKCKSKYRTKKEAEDCERMAVEKQVFKVGDKVTATMEQFKCAWCAKVFFPTGKITKAFVAKNKDYTEEYVNKWLRNTLAQELLGKVHLRRYVMKYKCPKCGDAKNNLFYTAELRRYGKNKKKIA